MKRTIIALSCVLVTTLGLVACGGKSAEGDKNARWSKPQGVLVGCDGVMSNSQQCGNNPNNQQYMIQIDRN